MRVNFRPYLLVVIGIVGLMLIIVAFTDVILPWGGAGAPSVPSERTSPAALTPTKRLSPVASTRTATNVPIPTGTSSTVPTPHATITPILAPSPLPTAVPSPTPTPTPAPAALSTPMVSSTGALAYVEGNQLSVLMPNASTATTVADGVMGDGPSVAWSPDGRRLLYLTHADGSPTGTADTTQTPRVWDSETGETLHLAQDVPEFPEDVLAVDDMLCSPGGTRVLFLLLSQTSSRSAWVLHVTSASAWQLSDAAVSAAEWIDEDTVLHTAEGDDGWGLLSIRPSSQALTATATLGTPYTLSPHRDYVASFDDTPADGQSLRVLSLSDLAPLSMPAQPTVTVSDQSPVWSPDGRWVAYGAKAVKEREETGPYTLVADTTGLRETRILTGFLPEGWSPDGRLLTAFGCPDTTCRLTAVDPISGESTSIASGGGLKLWGAAWSPRGVYLAYGSAGSDVDPAGLTVWNRGTGERHHILQTEATEPLTDLVWAADGCSLYGAARQKGAEAASTVTAILRIGPGWQDRQLVAPRLPESGRPPAWVSDQVDSNLSAVSCPGPLLNGRRVVAYYGTPLGPGLGIVGRYGATETLRLLRDQADVYRALDPTVETIPAFHMVTTIADDYAGPDLDYNHRVSSEITRGWIDSVRAEGGWAILDVQPGRAPLTQELDMIESLLKERQVHLAVDPEFITEGDQVPGQDLGNITGPQVNWIQAQMDQIARATGERKMLVVHQFEDRMVEQKETILDYPLVDIVWDADGFGSPGSKIHDYDEYKAEAGFECGGFKLFYRYDDPLMTPEQVLSLDPPPCLVIYQ